MTVPLSHALGLATALFSLGLLGVIARKNIVFKLIAAEIMMNSAVLAFVVAGAHHRQADGQVMALFILTLAAAELALGLVLLQRMYRQHRRLDIEGEHPWAR